MIEYIRRKSNSLIFKIFLWLVIFSFAIVGFSGAFSIIGNTAASVDGKSYSIAELYSDTSNYMTQNNMSLSSDEEIYQLALALTNQRAFAMSIDSEVEKQGFTASDSLVKQGIIQEFSGVNGFDKAVYERYLKNMRISEPQLLDLQRSQVAKEQFQMGIAYGLKASPYYEKLLEPQFQKLTRLADVRYKLISEDDIKNVPAPSQEDLESYYDKNKENFRAPEYRKVKVFEYSSDDFKKTNPEASFISSFNQLMDGIDDDLSAGFSAQQLQEKHGGSLNEYIIDNQQKGQNGQKVDIPSEMIASIFSNNPLSPVIIGSDDTGVANALYSFEVAEVIPSRILALDEVKEEITKQLDSEYKQKALVDFIQNLSTQENDFLTATQNLSAPLIFKEGIDRVNLSSEINPFMDNRNLDTLYLSEAGEKLILNLQGNWYIFEVIAFKEGNSDNLASITEQRMSAIDENYAQSIYTAFIEDVYKTHKVKIKAGNIRSTLVPRLRSNN